MFKNLTTSYICIRTYPDYSFNIMASGEKILRNPWLIGTLCWSLIINHKYSNKIQISKWAGWLGRVGVICRPVGMCAAY